MKLRLIFFYLCLSSSFILGSERLTVGDLIFVTYRPCMICKIIEEEVDSTYSHLGIVIEIDKGSNVWIAEARGSVRKVKLKQFLYQASIADVYRLREKSLIDKHNFKQHLLFDYERFFHGLPYDSAFGWNNFDSAGNELLYCSEFITKLLNPFLFSKIQIRPMNYLLHYPTWESYFAPHPVPQGELGNNPQSLFNDLDLVFIASLSDNNKLPEE